MFLGSTYKTGMIGNKGIVTNGLVLHLDAGISASYPGTGTTWYNLAGNGNTGTLVNGPTFSADYNGSVSFDGVDDYVNISSENGIANSSEITAELFVKINGTTNTSTVNWGGHYLMFRQNSRSGNFEGFTMVFAQNSNVFFSTTTPSNGSPQLSVSSSTIVSYGTIYHFCTTFKSYDSVKVYINGNLENTSAVAHNLDLPSTRTLKLGRSAFSFEGPAKATIYNAKVYNRVLTAAEIKQNYNALKGRYGL